MFIFRYASGENERSRSSQNIIQPFRLLILAGLAISTLLSGCTFIRAITFDQDEDRSGILTNQKAHMRAIFKKDITADRWPPPLSHLPALPDNKLIQECTGSQPVSGLVPIVPLVTVGAMLFMDSVTTAIEGYIAEKRRTMEKTYGGHINEPKVILPSSGNPNRRILNCIDVVRMVKIQTRDMLAMRVIFQFQTIGAYHYLRPIYLSVPYAAAVTEQNKGIKVAVNLRMTAAIVVNNVPKLVTPINENFVFKSVKLGKVYHFSPNAAKKEVQLEAYESPIFVWPTNVEVPSTLFVSVTEIGSGVELFDKASPELQGASKQLKEAIKSIIKEELGE